MRNSSSIVNISLTGSSCVITNKNARGEIINCLPDDWTIGWDCPIVPAPTKQRQHLQLLLPEINEVLSILDAAEGVDTLSHAVTDGFNRVNTTNTGVDEFHDAMLKRHRLNDPTRPFKVAKRHLDGYTKEMRSLYGILNAIIDRKSPPKPDPTKRYLRYTGTKRRHFELCAVEFTANFTNDRQLLKHMRHSGSVKWGELSDRPRAILVQEVVAQGCEGVKKGTPLRLPIAIEGGYRDHFEEALHKWKSRRGHLFTASGLDSFKRGKWIKEMVEPGDMVLSCDWSSFDGSLGLLGNIERDVFYETCVKRWGKDKHLRAVLDAQIRCTVQAGPYRARLFGNRGSGTAGTSTGNKMVVLSALHYALGPAMRGKNACKLFCDGDDTLIIVPPTWQGNSPSGQPWYTSWARRLTAMGLETKIQQCIVDSPEISALNELRFCRAGVVETSRGAMLCKIPSDAIRVMTNFRRHFRGPYFLDYCQTLFEGWNHVYGDVPVLSALTHFFDVGGKFNAALYDGAGLEYMIQQHKSGKPGAITEYHRESFAKTFNISVEDQLKCEHLLRSAAPHARALLRARRFEPADNTIWQKTPGFDLDKY